MNPCAHLPRTRLVVRLGLLAAMIPMLAAMVGCPDHVARHGAPAHLAAPLAPGGDPAGEAYAHRGDNPFYAADREPLSTFSISVDTASYSNVRRFLRDNRLPPKDAVRIEEFINYFDYGYARPDGKHPIAIQAEVGPCPWNPHHRLVRIGIQGKTIPAEETPQRNLVFLVDTSGSMNAPNRLPLFQQGLRLLVRQLTARDRVAIVQYAGRAGLVLPSTPGNQHETVIAAIDSLFASGSTNGGEGIQMAYRIAEENYVKGGANRVILGTDGDFNVGVTGSELIRLVEAKRDSGVFLTVLGFGMGNLKDATLEGLSKHGNGQYAYIDSLAEAQRVFVSHVGGLIPIANDVKVQVELNPGQVKAYRLIGYENRLLADHDFNDDSKDAGDMGAGHSVTALYQIVPPGVVIDLPKLDPLKYQNQSQPAPAAASKELLTVKVRYIPPEEKVSCLLTATVSDGQARIEDTSDSFRLAAAVASFGMLLRDSPCKGMASYAAAEELAQNVMLPDPHGHRQEFVQLLGIARRLAHK